MSKAIILLKELCMKTLIRKKSSEKKDVAQCCAKISPVKVGCHD